MTIPDAFLEVQIAAYKAEILALNVTILALASKQQAQYSEDSGQTRIVVTRHDLPRLRKMREDLMNELNSLCNQLNGTGSFNMAPGY